ncbi:E3 ubiquitin-protein ligase ATL23 [Mangifera indica]|uniref:E3 ubiquitin-protein ligase ATL23 n=1 Tax=Mangifera indica TaxID=29780 RepID=UPI001CF984D0|nr:E3 ubiquitin-protein ligase ATL23 [Mangifera indica]
MRYGVHYASQPVPSLSPAPPIIASSSVAATIAANNNHHNDMLASVLLALFLPCLGMSGIFIVYICLLWYVSSLNHHPDARFPTVKPVAVVGLSASELEKLPKVSGKELVVGTECAVCLDEIESEQPVRLVPGCNHGFHLQCGDAWLSRQSACPVCRGKLDSEFFKALEENPC